MQLSESENVTIQIDITHCVECRFLVAFAIVWYAKYYCMVEKVAQNKNRGDVGVR